MRVSLGEGTALIRSGGHALVNAQQRFVRTSAGRQALTGAGHATAAVLSPLRFQGGRGVAMLKKIGPWGLVVGTMGFMAETLFPFLQGAQKLWSAVQAADKKAGAPYFAWSPVQPLLAPIYVKWG